MTRPRKLDYPEKPHYPRVLPEYPEKPHHPRVLPEYSPSTPSSPITPEYSPSTPSTWSASAGASGGRAHCSRCSAVTNLFVRRRGRLPMSVCPGARPGRVLPQFIRFGTHSAYGAWLRTEPGAC